MRKIWIILPILVLLIGIALFIIIFIYPGYNESPPSPPRPNLEAEYKALEDARFFRKTFFYTGECDAKCDEVIKKYEDVAKTVTSQEVKAEALLSETEFLIWLSKNEEATSVINRLNNMQLNSSQECILFNLWGAMLQRQGQYIEAINKYNFALEKNCPNQDNIKRSICSIYGSDLGNKEKAREICPGSYPD